MALLFGRIVQSNDLRHPNFKAHSEYTMDILSNRHLERRGIRQVPF